MPGQLAATVEGAERAVKIDRGAAPCELRALVMALTAVAQQIGGGVPCQVCSLGVCGEPGICGSGDDGSGGSEGVDPNNPGDPEGPGEGEKPDPNPPGVPPAPPPPPPTPPPGPTDPPEECDDCPGGGGISLRFIRDNGDEDPDNDDVLGHLNISKLLTTTNLTDTDGHLDPDNFVVEAKFSTTEAADAAQLAGVRIVLQALRPDGEPFMFTFDGEGDAPEEANPRDLRVPLSRLPGEDVFRTPYLRLVVDRTDYGADGLTRARTLLISPQPDVEGGDTHEILGQKVRAELYRGQEEKPLRRKTLAVGSEVDLPPRFSPSTELV